MFDEFDSLYCKQAGGLRCTIEISSEQVNKNVDHYDIYCILFP